MASASLLSQIIIIYNIYNQANKIERAIQWFKQTIKMSVWLTASWNPKPECFAARDQEMTPAFASWLFARTIYIPEPFPRLAFSYHYNHPWRNKQSFFFIIHDRFVLNVLCDLFRSVIIKLIYRHTSLETVVYRLITIIFSLSLEIRGKQGRVYTWINTNKQVLP